MDKSYFKIDTNLKLNLKSLGTLLICYAVFKLFFILVAMLYTIIGWDAIAGIYDTSVPDKSLFEMLNTVSWTVLSILIYSIIFYIGLHFKKFHDRPHIPYDINSPPGTYI